MELTDNIIDMTYKFAWTFLKRNGRTDIDHHDLAHDAMVKLANAAPVKPEHLRRRVWLDIKSVFFEFYTNTTTRKHNVLLDAVCADFDMHTHDADTVSATDTFLQAFKKMYEGQPTLVDILTQILNGKTVQEIAELRGITTKGVYFHLKHARGLLKSILMPAA